MNDGTKKDNPPQPMGVMLGEGQSGEFPAVGTVPVDLVATVPRRDPPNAGLDPKSLEAMKNKEVEVYANGIVYRGTLQGTDGEDIYLRTDLRYVTVALDRVSPVVLKDAPKQPLDPGTVSPSFYDAKPDDEG